MEGKIELYSFGSLLAAVLGLALSILLLSWLAGLLLRVPEAFIRRLKGYDGSHPLYRGHHTRRVLTTVLGLAMTVNLAISEYGWTLSQEPSSPLPSEEAWVTVLLSDYMAIALVAGALVLGIRIFRNPPPVEDEEESGE